MKIIILAAGFATRLRPLTDETPKALLPIGGKPILDYTIDPLSKFLPTTPFALVTNHTYITAFESWQKAHANLPLTLLDNGVTATNNRLGAIGDLIYTLDQTGWDDDLLVLASDTLTSLNWSLFLQFTSAHHEFPCTIVCPTDNLEIIRGKLGCAIVEDDQLTSFVEKPSTPPSNLRAVPFYYFPRSILGSIRDYYKKGQNLDSPGSLLPYLLSLSKIFVYNLGESGYYHDVGTVEVYQSLQSDPTKLL